MMMAITLLLLATLAAADDYYTTNLAPACACERAQRSERVDELLWAAAGFDRHFKENGVGGSVTIYDYGRGRWLYTDRADAERQTLPASTFKILNSLMALESGAVASVDEVIAWDGLERGFGGSAFAPWNRDHSLRSAFAVSAVWVHEELARRIGRDAQAGYLRACGYGNGKLDDTSGVNFWVRGGFGVSPREQIEMLVGLYRDALPFAKAHQQAVKAIMREQGDGAVTIYAKTGWTDEGRSGSAGDNAAEQIGWWLGYAQTEDNVFFFVTRLTMPVAAVAADQPELSRFLALRKTITAAILLEAFGVDLNLPAAN